VFQQNGRGLFLISGGILIFMKKKFVNFLIALFLAVFLNNHLAPVRLNREVYQQVDSRFLKFIYHLLSDISTQLNSITAMDGLVLIVIFLLLAGVNKIKKSNLSKTQLVLSAILSLGIIFNFSFSLKLGHNDTSYFYILVKDSVQIIKTFCTFVSWFIFYNILQIYFEAAVNKFSSMISFDQVKQDKKDQNKGHALLFLKNLGSVLVMWSPFLIVNYPGAITFDALHQLFQFHGYEPLITQHPISSTVFINYFFDFGKFLGSARLGIFLGVLIQTVLLACGFSLVIMLFQIFIKNKNISKILLILIGVLPIVVSLFSVVTKDVIFSAAFLLFNFYLAWSLFDEKGKRKKMILVNIFIWSTLALLFRKNVLYILLLFILCSIVLMLFKNRYVKLTTLLVLVLSVFAFKGIDSGLSNLYNADNRTLKRETLSIPFQQTARYIKYHKEEMTKSELKKIDRVLEIDGIAMRYDPVVSDHVKSYFNEKSTPNELADYFKTWYYELTQHPITYFEATIQQNISLISPFFSNNHYYLHVDNSYRPRNKETNQFLEKNNLISSPTMWSLQEIEAEYFKIFDSLPLVGQLENPAIYIIGLFFILALAIKYKYRRIIYLMMPALLLLLTLVAGPVVEGYIRYTVIFAFLFPLFLIVFAIESKQSRANKDSEDG